MINSEKQIEAMGYEIRVVDMINNYVVYENKKKDQEITLEWDDEDQYCMLFSQTISREKDWLGHTRQMPQALNICELEIFTARLRELRFNEQQKERHNESNNQGCYYISRN